MQPAIIQTPNVERTGQQQVANPQTAQAAFAAELQRRASDRPSQVQHTEAQQGAQPGAIKPEERGEKPPRRPLRKRVRPAPKAAAAEAPAPEAAPGEGKHVDVTV